LQLLEVNIKATEEEKKRIGKELHDGIAGSIIKLIHEVEEDEGSGLSQKLLKTYNEVRDLSHQLNNTPMHGELLFDSLFEVIPENKRNQIFTLNINPKYLTLIEPYSTHVLRIIQELITNNLKYSQASKTLIDIQFKDDLLKIKYIDNGIGAPNIKKGSGLKNIENRVAIVKGKTLIQSQEKGFEVKIEIPYKNEEHTNY
jgi:signal transduction histidine kinase